MAKKAKGPAKGSKTITLRDQDYLQALRDGRVLRAQTFQDRRKAQSKKACRQSNREW